MNTIVYASYFEPLTVYIRQLCKVEDIDADIFDGEITEDIEVVLLSTPIQVEGSFWDVSQLWRTYLQRVAPQVKLIVFGLDKFESDNYIDAIKPIPSLKAKIAKAKKVSDDMILPQGMNPRLDHLLRRFLEGHGNESIRQVLMRVHRITKMAENERDNFDTSTEQIWEDLLNPNQVADRWHTFVNRWGYYYPFFKPLPFYSYFEEINEIIASLSHALDHQQALLTPHSYFSKDFEAVKEWLKKIEQYVYG